MKPVLSLFSVLLLPVCASAASLVNFADSGTSASLTAFIEVGAGSPNYVTGTNPDLLTDGGAANFAGNLFGNSSITVWLDVYDDGGAPGTQAAFMIFNLSGSPLVLPVNQLSIGVSGLFALGGADLSPEFTFAYIGIDGVTLTSEYDPVTGSFAFSNTSEITIPNGSPLVVTGNFNVSAIPEPSAGAIIAGLAGFGLAISRRRRC